MVAPWRLFALLSPLLCLVANYCDQVAVDRFPLTPAQICAVMCISFSSCVSGAALLLGTTRAFEQVSATLVRAAEWSQPIFVLLLDALLTRLRPRYVQADLSRRTVLRESLAGCGIPGGAHLLPVG